MAAVRRNGGSGVAVGGAKGPRSRWRSGRRRLQCPSKISRREGGRPAIARKPGPGGAVSVRSSRPQAGGDGEERVCHAGVIVSRMPAPGAPIHGCEPAGRSDGPDAGRRWNRVRTAGCPRRRKAPKAGETPFRQRPQPARQRPGVTRVSQRRGISALPPRDSIGRASITGPGPDRIPARHRRHDTAGTATATGPRRPKTRRLAP